MRSDAPALTLDGTARIGGLHVFGPLHLTVLAGRITCLLGPSGVGKTTLLRLIAGVDDVTDFTGQITASDDRSLTGRMALMAQGDLLMPWLDVLGNVTLGARLRGEARDRTRAMRMLARVGLQDHAHKRPGALSGGQKQRVALARTLMEERAIVLLDEPFSALDARTRVDMQELAAETLAGRTVLLVTHDPSEAARMGDRVSLMEHGHLHAMPVPDEPAIRGLTDPATLRFGADLMTRLRAA